MCLFILRKSFLATVYVDAKDQGLKKKKQSVALITSKIAKQNLMWKKKTFCCVKSLIEQRKPVFLQGFALHTKWARVAKCMWTWALKSDHSLASSAEQDWKRFICSIPFTSIFFILLRCNSLKHELFSYDKPLFKFSYYNWETQNKFLRMT